MKLLVTTGSFIAGAVIDDKTGLVKEADHNLAHLRGLSKEKFMEFCRENKWAVSEVP